MQLIDFIFYFFAGVLALSGAMVVSARNPIHSVLFLVLAFFNAAILFIMSGAEYIAMTLIIVYVGAVAVLFLFVVMMLDINITRMREGFVRYLIPGVGFAVFIFCEIILIISASLQKGGFKVLLQKEGDIESQMRNNTEAIGNVLYTDYSLPFQVAGLILLVAMIGAIVLTHRRRQGVRKQSISAQVGRRRSESVAVVKVQSGEGIS